MTSDAKVGGLEILPSGRLCRRVTSNRSGKPVYIDGEKKLVCVHGERGYTIQGWLTREAKGEAREKVRFSSPCNCENVLGLMSEYDVAEADVPQQTAFDGVFALLGAIGAEERIIRTIPQRLAFSPGNGVADIWVQPNGKQVCEHGNSRVILAKMQKSPSGAKYKGPSRVVCNCKWKVPRREGSIFGERGPKKQRGEEGAAPGVVV